MKEKFTPGPWQWWTSNSWLRLTAHNLPGGQYKQEGDVICPVVATDGHPNLIVTQANANLVAAAPELYRALDAAKNALRSYQYGNASPELAEAIADMADKALAKAGGR